MYLHPCTCKKFNYELPLIYQVISVSPSFPGCRNTIDHPYRCGFPFEIMIEELAHPF